MAAGNLERVWDANHPSQGQTEPPTTTFSYDGLNRLMTVTQPWAGVGGGDTVTQYGYAVRLAGGPLRLSFRLILGSGKLVAGRAPIVRVRASLRKSWSPRMVDGEIHAYHVDHLDTPRFITDGAQTEIWRGELYPFGELFQEQGSASSKLRFPGQVWDEEAGLSYNWHRWYDAKTGRYTRVDPIGFAGGQTNFYAYAAQNPQSYVDPAGLNCSIGAWRLIKFRYVFDRYVEVWKLVRGQPIKLPRPGRGPRGTGGASIGCVCEYAMAAAYEVYDVWADYEQTITCECGQKYKQFKTEYVREYWRRVWWVGPRPPQKRYKTIWLGCAYCPPQLR